MHRIQLCALEQPFILANRRECLPVLLTTSPSTPLPRLLDGRNIIEHNEQHGHPPLYDGQPKRAYQRLKSGCWGGRR